MKLTRHNGRSGKNGTYNPKHNDRRFDVENSEHIDAGRTDKNVYWDCYQGFHYPENAEQEEQIVHSFEEIEGLFYWEQYEDYCKAQHARNRKNGHPERDRSPDDLRLDKKTSPEESLIQIGTIEGSISGEELQQIAVEFFEEFSRRFGEHVHILDWSLHLDEATPHIHERHVFDCPNRYGEIAPQQEKALEVLGIELPRPDQKSSRTNNRKITFDAMCRTMLFEIVKRHGLHLDQEPEYGGRSYLEKQDYILQKQRKQIAENTSQLEETEKKLESVETDLWYNDMRLRKKCDWIAEADRNLEELKQDTEQEEEKLKLIQKQYLEKKGALEDITAKLSDTEKFIEEISDNAYAKAVETVTEKVIEETHNMDFEVIEQFREKVKTNLPYEGKYRRIVYDITAILMEDFRGLTKTITGKMQQLFSDTVFSERMRGEIMTTVRNRLKFGPPMADSMDEQQEESQVIRRHRTR